jgi:predicted RND superfamily exporter protein
MGDSIEAGTLPPTEFSRDGRAVLVRIASKATINDLEEARRLTADVRAIADGVSLSSVVAGGPGIRVRLGGAYAISATSSGTIRHDSIVSTIVSVVLLYGLFVLFYRRWLTPILIGVVAGAGMVVGFGVHAIGAPTLSPLATAVAALLAGLGVDYGIHFVSHFDEERARGLGSQFAAANAARVMALPITTNCFTSIFGFASLWPSPIEMLSDFATLGAVGLIGAWLAAFTLLPALLVLTHRGKDSRSSATAPRFGGIADAIGTRPRLWLSSSLTLLAIAIGAATVRGQLPQIEGDLTVLHPQPNEALRTTEEIVTRFAGQGEMIPVLVRVDDPANLVTRAADAARALEADACKDIGVVDVLGLHRLVPDPRGISTVDEMLRSIEPKALVARFRDAVDRSAFDLAQYEAYATFLERLLTPTQMLGTKDIEAYPSIAQRLFARGAFDQGRQPTETLLVVRLEKPLRDREARGVVVSTLRRELGSVPGATLAGLPAVSVELEDSTKEGLPQSIGISLCLVLCWLGIVFRRVMDVVLALLPLVFAATFTMAFMVAIGEKFNPINCIAIPLLDGIAVDAGVFLVSVAREARKHGGRRDSLLAELRPTMRAVLLAVATTVTGFLSLTATHTPAIRSLGMVAAVGIFASLVGSMCVLVPWLLRRAETR